jgi:hypothetical protein
MKKLISLSLVAVFGLALTFTACKKYEDGPLISLASKKSRVVNVWKVEKIIDNGVDVTAQAATWIAGYSIEFKKDNSYVSSFVGSSSVGTGIWAFDTKKENLIITGTGSSVADISKILRLKSKELWLKNTYGTDVEEVHYVTK